MTEQYQKVAVHGLIKNGNKILVTRRAKVNDWKPGEWDLPGGTVEFGETDPEKALVREIREETSLEVIINKPIHMYSSMSGTSRHQFQLVYECIYQGGEIKLNPEEHDDFLWVTPDKLPSLPLIAFLKDLYDKVLKY